MPSLRISACSLLIAISSLGLGETVAPAPAPNPNDPALVSASHKGDMEGVKAALKLGASASAKDAKSGQTALMLAALKGNLDIVKLLLSKGANANAQEDKYGQTALMMAAMAGQLDIVKALVEKGADVNIKETKYQQTAVKMAEAKGQTAIVEYLNNPKGTASGGTSQDGSVVIAAPNLNDQLMEAASKGDAVKVKELLDKGADPEAKNGEGVTALTLAARGLHSEVIKLLRAAAGDTSPRSAPGLSPKEEKKDSE